ncbi:hypothetical protein BN126360175 [Stenotrophomonas thermophila]|nr:hypothetical protein BN126360175 [Stenotrophomonas maltophilia]
MISQQRSTDALSDESRQFSLLVNSVTDYAIYMLDTAGFIRTWNTGGQRIKGYTAADVVGSHFSRFYLPEEAEAGFPQRNLRVAAEEGRYACEGWRLRQDGTPFRASVVIDPIWVDGDLVGFAKITRDITELHQAQEQLLEAQRELFQAQKMELLANSRWGWRTTSTTYSRSSPIVWTWSVSTWITLQPRRSLTPPSVQANGEHY